MSYIINKVFNENCISFLKQNSINVDHTITDIPYDIVSRESNGIRNFNKEEADLLEFDLSEFIKQITEITKEYIFIFCSSEQVSMLVELLEKENFHTDLAIWKKSNPSPVNGQHIWLSGIECCVVASKNELPNEMKDMIWNIPNGKSKDHPTEKPLKLMSLIINNYTKENDIILDPCAGSGSTLISSKVNNRNYIGIEKHKPYYELINNKLKKQD